MLSPHLIAIGGFAGAGKSTLARNVGQALALPVYEIDQVSRFVSDSPFFSDTEPKGVAFDVIYGLAQTHLENGCSLIFDQNLGREATWNHLERVRASVGAKLVVIILDCPYELCVERAMARTSHPDFGDINIHEHKYKWDYLNDNEFPDAIRIDAARSEREVFDEAMSHLRPLVSVLRG